MNSFVVDTMALVLFLENRKLPDNIKQLFKEADSGQTSLIIPSMVLAEIAYLSEKKRIDLTLNEIETYIKKHSSFSVYDQNLLVIKSSFEITDIPELHDRLIAGTAKMLNLPLLTNDPKIRASIFMKTLWDS